MTQKTLNFITGNANKLAEVKAILGDYVELQSKSLEVPELQGSVEDISRFKCRSAADMVQGPVLVEDTCLGFDALEGLPGPYITFDAELTSLNSSKWFLQSLGHEGLNNLLAAYDDKSAQAICSFAYSKGPGHEPTLFQGITHGKIVPARGPKNFGWDPIFEYEGQTFAEMTPEAKNAISHRSKALAKLKDWLASEDLSKQ